MNRNSSKPMNFIQYTVDDSGILKQERRKRGDSSKATKKNNNNKTTNTVATTTTTTTTMNNNDRNITNDIPMIHNRNNNDPNSNNIATSVSRAVNYSDPRSSNIPSTSLNIALQQSPTSSNDGNSSSSSSKRKRSQVKRSCIHCRRAHSKCDETRPCARCVYLGLSDSCEDVEIRKRGRKSSDEYGRNFFLDLTCPQKMSNTDFESNMSSPLTQQLSRSPLTQQLSRSPLTQQSFDNVFVSTTAAQQQQQQEPLSIPFPILQNIYSALFVNPPTQQQFGPSSSQHSSPSNAVPFQLNQMLSQPPQLQPAPSNFMLHQQRPFIVSNQDSSQQQEQAQQMDKLLPNLSMEDLIFLCTQTVNQQNNAGTGQVMDMKLLDTIYNNNNTTMSSSNSHVHLPTLSGSERFLPKESIDSMKRIFSFQVDSSQLLSQPDDTYYLMNSNVEDLVNEIKRLRNENRYMSSQISNAAVISDALTRLLSTYFGIIIGGAGGFIIYWNNALMTTLGYTREDTNVQWHHLIHENDFPFIAAITLRDCMNQVTETELSYVLKAKDGTAYASKSRVIYLYESQTKKVHYSISLYHMLEPINNNPDNLVKH